MACHSSSPSLDTLNGSMFLGIVFLFTITFTWLEMSCCPSQTFQLVIKFPISDISFHVVCNIESSVILSRFAAMYFMRKFIICIGY